MLNDIKLLIENFVNNNPSQPLHFLIEESFKANKTVVLTKENILLICKNLLLDNINIFKEFQLSRKAFENDWVKERIPYLINEFENTITENPQYFNFEYSDIQEKMYFYYSKQIDQVNVLTALKYEDINNEFLTNWKVITDDINDKLEKVINELTDQFTEYDRKKVQFIDETKCKTKDMMLECSEDIDADFLINSNYYYFDMMKINLLVYLE